MLHSALGLGGCVTAPHRAASLAGYEVLRAGGSAIEAMVAMASTIAVVYPHMNGIGGDAFWLIHRPGEMPTAISGAGRAAALATVERYAARGHETIPVRGPDAVLLVPGAVATWHRALELLGGRHMPLDDLLKTAIAHAEDGIAASQSQDGDDGLAHGTSSRRARVRRAVPAERRAAQGGRPLPPAGDRRGRCARSRTMAS